jgi:two-component system OmpR family response regulator
MENYGILLVDDELAYHAILSALLASPNGTIDCVASAAAALEAVCARRYDLILMDIDMAGGDGYHALAAVRAAGEWARSVPIIAFTTQRLSGGERHYIDAGFDGWLAKPFEAAELVRVIRRWLGAERLTPGAEPPGTNLALLLGVEPAAAIIDRFHANLREAIAEIDAGGNMRSCGHRLGGLAGTLGFGVLSAAWLALQEGEASAWPTVRALTLEAIARHDSARPSPGVDGIGA